ncbi:hypothetical protein J0H58_12730 [bacterium]|nr:hypothetical protein [bacterium]
MKFSVIYTADVPADEDVLDHAPPHVSDLWDQTEGDDQFEYGYLEGRWDGGHHRKWCAVLTRDEFDEFVRRCGLVAEDVQTMGSLGAPGVGFGWAPAISFNGDDPAARNPQKGAGRFRLGARPRRGSRRLRLTAPQGPRRSECGPA